MERVELNGYMKKRYRCPKCYRGLLPKENTKGYCSVHLRDFKEPIDLKKAIENNKEKILREVNKHSKKGR